MRDLWKPSFKLPRAKPRSLEFLSDTTPRALANEAIRTIRQHGLERKGFQGAWKPSIS
jgi:hypothetical protein